MQRPGIVSLSEKPSDTGKCNICLSSTKLTEEHVPPKSAFNDCPRLFHRLHISDRASEEAHAVQTRGGFRVKTLCRTCNNELCSQYAKQYVLFARHCSQNAKILALEGGTRHLSIPGDTLMIAKQIAAMILAIQSTQFAESNGWLRRFVTDSSMTVNPRFRILAFLVPNISVAGTINRLEFRKDVLTCEPDFECHAGEISFFPFGFVYAYDIGIGYATRRMTDITHWFRNDHPCDRLGQSISLHTRLAGIGSYYDCRGVARRAAQVDYLGKT